ncbi:MAG: hypothetical protein ACXW1D_08320, partial [Halobacteriota archaeon]
YSLAILLSSETGRYGHFSKRHLRDLTHMDIATQTESVIKLAQLKNISLMATAHTGFTTEFESAISDWA